MKKIKLGFLTLLAVFVGSVAFVRCSNDTEGDVKLEQEIVVPQKSDREIYVQNVKVILQDNTEINGQIQFTIDSDTGDLLDMGLSRELLDPAIGIDPGSILAEVRTMGEHSDCMKACRDTYIDPETGKVKIDPATGKPISGYGGCKFNCWVDSTIRFISALSPVLSAASTL